jgi:hypothetical protein
MQTNPCQLLAKYAAVLAIGLLLAASSARAVTFDFTSDHCTNGCGTPPFGTVTLTANGTGGVDITVHLLDSNTWANTASTDNELFKFNDATISLSDIVVTQTFAGETLEAQQAASAGGFNGDGTGEFNFGIACTTCKNGATGISSDIVFTVNNTTIADLTQVNNLGIIFVADILSGTTGNTGPVDVTPGSRVPDSGSTALLLGLGLFGLGFVRAPFRKKA